MDKYIRDDDMNDDNMVYRGESYENLSKSQSKHQELRVKGQREEIEIRYAERYKTLSPQESRLLSLIMGGKSIRAAANTMKIAQPTAQEYWNNIKGKMK